MIVIPASNLRRASPTAFRASKKARNWQNITLSWICLVGQINDFSKQGRLRFSFVPSSNSFVSDPWRTFWGHTTGSLNLTCEVLQESTEVHGRGAQRKQSNHSLQIGKKSSICLVSKSMTTCQQNTNLFCSYQQLPQLCLRPKCPSRAFDLPCALLL